MRTVELETDFGTVKATWRREGRMIVVQYGERQKRAQASGSDIANDIVARNILRGWVVDDLKNE